MSLGRFYCHKYDSDPKGIHYPIPTVNLSCENTNKGESLFSTSVTALVSFSHISS